jgi:hypothetical protein
VVVDDLSDGDEGWERVADHRQLKGSVEALGEGCEFEG